MDILTRAGIDSKEVFKAISQISSDKETQKNIIYDLLVDVRRGQSLEDALKLLKEKKVEWRHPGFDDILFKQHEQDEFIKNPFEVEEGVLQCPKCSKSRTFSYSKQTRSADEPMTTFATCMSCKHKWTYSG